MRTVESYRSAFRRRSSARPTRPPSPTESHRGVQVLFVAVVAMVAVVGSERMYWYWETSFVEHLAQTGFYAVPVAAFLGVVDRFGVDGLWPLLVATPIYADVVEGALTPVLYEAGPLVPILPAYFAFWHGLVAVGIGVVAVRALLLRRASKRLLAVATGMGALWGTWATTLRLPDHLVDPDLLAEHGIVRVLGPGDFARYALVFGAVFAAGHWLLGLVWRTHLTRSPVATAVVVAPIVATVAMWTVAIPWAAPTFAAYVALQWWVLRRRHHRAPTSSVLVRLDGRIAAASLWPLAALPAAAAGSYTVWWWLDPDEWFIREILLHLGVATHTIIGFAVTVIAIVMTLAIGRGRRVG